MIAFNTRVSNINPSFFNTYFPNNTVPPRYKISRSANLGSSSGTTEQKATARKVIANHLLQLPNDVRYIFTDGSAKPNPGPAGSGVVITSTSNHHDHIHACTAALGCATNNTGELVAIGIGIELCVADNYNRDIYIYTDSKLMHNALTRNHNAGADNDLIIQFLRQRMRDYKRNTKSNIIIKWIPGHSGIPLNDVADTLAGAGSDISKQYTTDFDLTNTILNHGFNYLVTLTTSFASKAIVNTLTSNASQQLMVNVTTADLRSAQ